MVALFALFHDSRRINEYCDDGHGRRGGEFARSLCGSLVHYGAVLNLVSCPTYGTYGDAVVVVHLTGLHHPNAECAAKEGTEQLFGP